MGKINYGLKNVKYAVWDESTKKYGQYKEFAAGVVSLTSDAESNATDFYASDVVFATISAVAKETGTIEVADLTDDVLCEILGYEKDATSGLTIVDTEPKNVSVALAYETTGNEGRKRGVRYNVTFQRPSQSANTMTENITPDTITLNYTAVGRDFTIGQDTRNILKAHVDEPATGETSDAFTNFFARVLEPGKASTAA